jgi:hypothetical protein
MNVLIIPEDFRKDQYVLKPIIQRMFAEAGKPNANIRVCLDPLMGGISEAMKWERIAEVLDRYRMVQIFLLIVDRDGEQGRRQALKALEDKANQKLEAGRVFVAENAWQEIEVWALAGQEQLPAGWKWSAIRREVHPKEVYFEPLARQRGLLKEPGEGRTTLGREAAHNYPRVRSRCREDIENLEIRLKVWIAES